MSGYSVRVLGRVELWIGGQQVRLAGQLTLVLAMLVAGSEHGVSPHELCDVLWPEPSKRDLLYPLINRLKKSLAACELKISEARGGQTYRLQPVSDKTPLSAAVDAVAFENLASQARKLLTAGHAEAALGAFLSAAEIWREVPFAGVDEVQLPSVCARARNRWERTRSQLLQTWADTALKYADLTATPVIGQAGWPSPDEPPGDAVWLLRFLGLLRRDSPKAAGLFINARVREMGYREQLTARAFQLSVLREWGVVVDAAPPRGMPSSNGTPRELKIPCSDTPGLQPWSDLGGRLWAAALRDLTVSAEHWGETVVKPLTALVADKRDDGQAAHLLAALIQQMAGDGQLTIVVDSYRMSQRARDLGDRIAAALSAGRVQLSWAPMARRPDEHARNLLALGDARHDACATTEAEHLWSEVYTTATDPRVKAEALVRLARRWSEPGQVDTQLVALLKQGLAALDGAEDEHALRWRLQLRAHLAHKLTMAVVDRMGPRATEDHPGTKLALDTLGQLDLTTDAVTRCEVLTECRWALFDTEPPYRLVKHSDHLNRLSAGLANQTAHHHREAFIALVVDRSRLGHLDLARSALGYLRTHASVASSSLANWLLSTAETMFDLWSGNFNEAATRLTEAKKALDSVSGPLADTLIQTLGGQVFWLHREQGRFPELPTDVAAAIEAHTFFPVWVAGLSLRDCELGRFDHAADRVVALLAQTRDLETLPPHGWAVPTLVLLAETCAGIVRSGADPCSRLNIKAVLARLHELLLPHADEVALAGWPAVLLTPVARSLGLLRLASGDAAGALDWFGRAERLVGGPGPPLARLRYDRARALARVGGSGDLAAGLLQSVIRDAEYYGMSLLARQAKDLLD